MRWALATPIFTYERTPLYRAAVNGHEAIVRLLLETEDEADTKDRYGHIALHWAACNDYEAVV
jgi:ankyrin repeat protein